ncbi:alpha/beta-hydrolase [Cylindrobasidium torrendii FP15055 ss-10]|uniref:Alpha/beta-hydrolase n=1 Tax=Cylindrobasidium torrendii FP15055 ss-10 TaxID=1314674 RepID=A0A0D7AWG8_9AGAR|nr:alpha/beta-hydrolase [Cylindrobasidium torrendii FP15055 ss-10]
MMSSVYFPVRVATLFRRIFNVVSSYTLVNASSLPAPEPLNDKSAKVSVRQTLQWPTPNSVNGTVWSQALSNGALSWSWLRLGLSSLTEVSSSSSGYPQPPSPKQDMDPKRNRSANRRRDPIHLLMNHPALFDPLRVPRYPIVMCHGLYGFDELGPSAFPTLRMQYWSNVLRILRKTVKAQVIVTGVPSTGSVTSRAESLDRQLSEKAAGRGINLMAHSMGGLDCRQLITHVKPSEYAPLSLTTISTPHRGSPFMDWCSENIGIGRLIKREGERLAKTETKATIPHRDSDPPKSDTSFSSLSDSFANLPSSFMTFLISLLDSPAYANLTSTYLNEVFNPNTPDDPNVKYFSIAGRAGNINVLHPLWLPKMVLDGVEKKERERLREAWERDGETGTRIWQDDHQWGSDGMVTIQSAKWGEFLGVIEGADHWEIRGARGLEFATDFSGKGDWGWLASAFRRDKNDQATKKALEKKEEKVGVQVKMDKDIKVEDVGAVDKLSAAFDWVIDQVPAPLSKGKDGKEQPVQPPSKPRDLESKEDLERFYVALTRKLYDEGL